MQYCHYFRVIKNIINNYFFKKFLSLYPPPFFTFQKLDFLECQRNLTKATKLINFPRGNFRWKKKKKRFSILTELRNAKTFIRLQCRLFSVFLKNDNNNINNSGY